MTSRMAKPGLGLILLVCALVLASCVSPEEIRREDEATCVGYGFHANTNPRWFWYGPDA
jgi:hypothetical protein